MLLSFVLWQLVPAWPPPAAKVPARAFTLSKATSAGKQVLAAAPSPDESAFACCKRARRVRRAQSADRSRAVFARLQYYLVRDDASARKLLAARIPRGRAWRQGAHPYGRSEYRRREDILLCLAKQRGTEVRLYNPFPAGRFSTLSRIEASATDARRISAACTTRCWSPTNALA